MAGKDVLAFLIFLAQDRQFGERVTSTGPEELLKAAAEAGFHFTWEELETVVRDIKGTGEEVSDEVLDLIAGGVTPSEIQAWVSEKLSNLPGI